MAAETRIEDLYSILSGDDDKDRTCEAIPEDACTELPRNYVLNVTNGAATKWAEQLAGPNLVLPWLLTALGAPAYILGFLMPVRQTGSLLPQLIVAGRIRRFARRQWFWVGAGLIQAAMLLLMIPIALTFSPILAGILIVLLLALFSIASGVGSVAFQDVVGKTIPKGRRGRLLANRALIGGILTIATGIALKYWLGDSSNINFYLVLIFIAAALWALAAFLFANMEEFPGATDGGRNVWEEIRAGIKLLKAIPGYRKFVLARVALLSIEIAAPFYVLHAQTLLKEQISSLGILVVTVGLAKVLSSPFWGRFSDTSSRKVLIYGGVLGVATAVFALVIGAIHQLWQTPFIYAPVFLFLGFAEEGVRLGRKTYLVDAATPEERPTYVAFANTAVGLVTLLMGLLGLIAHYISIEFLIIVLAGLSLIGVLISSLMPEAEKLGA